MRDKGQLMLFSEAELHLIKSVFADNEELLYAIRNVLLQFPLTDAQEQMIKGQVTPEVVAVLKKRMLPDLEPDMPLGQLSDIRVTLTDTLKTKQPEDMSALFAAKDLEIAYLEQQFSVLAGYDIEEKLKLSDMRTFSAIGDPFQTYVNLTAYLFLLGYIDPRLIDIKTMAGIKEETPEEQKKRLKHNSNQ